MGIMYECQKPIITYRFVLKYLAYSKYNDLNF